MSAPPRVLLINPAIAKARNARFPLAVLSLASALENRATTQIIDGNVEKDYVDTTLRAFDAGRVDAVGVSVMGGPQLQTAIAVSKAIRARSPTTPIIWGGHFPTICPEAVLNDPYADYAVRGQGEDTFTQLIDAIVGTGAAALPKINGLSWRPTASSCTTKANVLSGSLSALPYERLDNPRQYLARTYLGRRTAGYQAALGCRFRCTFCGVASMFRGKTALPLAVRLEEDLACSPETRGGFHPVLRS